MTRHIRVELLFLSDSSHGNSLNKISPFQEYDIRKGLTKDLID